MVCLISKSIIFTVLSTTILFKYIFFYRKSLTRQKTQNKQLLRVKDQLEKQRLSLEQQCNNLQQKLNDLQNVLEKERVLFRQSQIGDAKLMEQLRIKLEGALDMQDELERVLEEERHCRRALEVQIEELRVRYCVIGICLYN